MRTKFVAATIIAGVLFIASCKWFSPDSKPTAFNIVGTWKVDTMLPGKDSSKNLMMALAFIVADTGKLQIQFDADSTYTNTSNNKSKYYVTGNELYLLEDSPFVPLQLNILNDSLINLYTEDSARYVLHRQ